MNFKPVFIAFLAGLPLLAGCTTLQGQRRESMREQSETERLASEVSRLKARIEALETERERVYGEVDGLRSSAAAESADTARRLSELEESVKALDRARERDRQAVIDALTKKIADLMQSRATPKPRQQSGYEHVVQSGETLSEIAREYGVSVNAVINANNLKDPNSLRVGQTLFIPE